MRRGLGQWKPATRSMTSSCRGRSGISKERSSRNALATSRSFQISAGIGFLRLATRAIAVAADERLWASFMTRDRTEC